MQETATLPLATLVLPVVVMAASTWKVLVVGGVLIATSLALYFIPSFATPEIQEGLVQRGIALAAGCRPRGGNERTSRQSSERSLMPVPPAPGCDGGRGSSSAIEAIGRPSCARASDGASRKSLTVLVARFGYRYPSIYVRDGDLMRLGAQRGYDEVIETFDGTVGVVGRVMRTGEPQFVPDVTVDPEYRAASPDVRSEISVPLHAADSIVASSTSKAARTRHRSTRAIWTPWSSSRTACRSRSRSVASARLSASARPCSPGWPPSARR